MYEGYSEDRLIDYVQFVAHAVSSLDVEQARKIMGPRFLFSSRVFGAVMPLLRVSAPRRMELAPKVCEIVLAIWKAKNEKPEVKREGKFQYDRT
jgi:hypothetical protein